MLINMCRSEEWMPRDSWREASNSGPIPYARAWLDSQGIKAVDVFRPRASFVDGGELQVIARIPISQLDAALLCSGVDGISTWEQRQHDSMPRHRAVWLPKGTTLQGAFKAAAGLLGA